MKFCEKLEEYIYKIDCTGKELAEASGLSVATVSRYRSGEREPAADSEQLHRLCSGYEKLCLSRNIDFSSSKTVFEELNALVSSEKCNGNAFAAKLDLLIKSLDINTNDLAKYLNYDPSYISRIRKGRRVPADVTSFAEGTASFAVKKCGIKQVNLLTGTDLNTSAECEKEIVAWMTKTLDSEKNSTEITGFLDKLNEFNLNEYISSIHFNDIKVPSVPFIFAPIKYYYGIASMRDGELDFMKYTVLSKSTDDVFMCNDMEMEDMAEDLDFSKKWMYGIAVMLKKGLKLNMIHNIERPFNELMLGLETWIPLYMTGQIRAYYIKGKHNDVYGHMNYCSGGACLEGECITGKHSCGRYYITRQKEELQYFRQKAEHLLEKAKPLLEVYRSTEKELFNSFVKSTVSCSAVRHNICSTPPLYSMPRDIVESVLARSNLTEDEYKLAIEVYNEQKDFIDNTLKNCRVIDDISVLSREEFEKSPVEIPRAGAFLEKSLEYTYDEYCRHLEYSKKCFSDNPNYSLKISHKKSFKNIQIQIIEGNFVCITKNRAPAVNFVIRHPKLVDAIENLILPVVE